MPERAERAPEPVQPALPVEADAPAPAARSEAPRRRERFAQSEQPEFLRRPVVRRPRREAPAADTAAPADAAPPAPVTADDGSRD